MLYKARSCIRICFEFLMERRNYRLLTGCCSMKASSIPLPQGIMHRGASVDECWINWWWSSHCQLLLQECCKHPNEPCDHSGGSHDLPCRFLICLVFLFCSHLFAFDSVNTTIKTCYLNILVILTGIIQLDNIG